MFSAAKKFVNPYGRALAIADAVNNEAGTEYTVSAGKNAGSRRHQGLRINRDQAARGKLNLVFRREKVETRGLADRHNDGVALDLGFAVFVERGIEAFILIEDPLGFEGFERGDLAIFA